MIAAAIASAAMGDKICGERIYWDHASVLQQASTRELARRLRGTGVTANCLHPGFVATRFADESGSLISRFAGLAKLLAISPEKGAESIIYLASSPKIAATTGRYF